MVCAPKINVVGTKRVAFVREDGIHGDVRHCSMFYSALLLLGDGRGMFSDCSTDDMDPALRNLSRRFTVAIHRKQSWRVGERYRCYILEKGHESFAECKRAWEPEAGTCGS